MSRNLTKSNAHFQRAVQKLPLGVASNFRYWGEERTIYVKQGRGARVWDLDDNVYVDYRLGYGPAILGYADPRVDAAAVEGFKVGGVFALSTDRELAVLQAIARGHTNASAADTLGISPKTVDTHRTNLMRKFAVNSTASLLLAAVRAGLLDPASIR